MSVGVTIFAVLLALDLLTKTIAAWWSELRFVDPTRNKDLTFSVSVVPESMVLVGSIAVTVGLIVAALRCHARGTLRWPFVAILTAGLAGNLIDRITLGAVRDWLPLGPTRWNLADFYQLVGLISLLIAVIRGATVSSTSRVTDN